MRSMYLRYDVIIGGLHYGLDKRLNGCKKVLDLGCGRRSPIQYCRNVEYSVGVDIFEPYIEESKSKKIHNEYLKMDLLDIDKVFEPKSFDCVLGLEILEHLPKNDGYDLINKMSRISMKKVIISTPNGFVEQTDCDGNGNQRHLSGWTVKDLKDLGFDVVGLHGYKALRKEEAKMRYKPEPLCLLVSDISQMFVRNYPDLAYTLLVVKEVRNSI